MVKSSLAKVVVESPNKSSPRMSKIDTITIHCMAGNLSVESCGAIFAKSCRKASSNYGIDSDGRIACYVGEEDRSWCSSNRANDNRAITIEVANDGGADTGWHVSDKAYKALISLLVDICRRNHIDKLVWSNSKSDRVNHKNGCNMTVHRDFANKSCPGDYLYSLHSKIANEVNSLLGVVKEDKPANKLYKVQVGSYSVKNNAINMQKRLKSYGIDSIIVEVNK